MYLTYGDYAALGGTVAEDAFAAAEAEAELWLDEVTMGRVADMAEPYPAYVSRAMAYLVDHAAAIRSGEEAAAGGDTVKQFSNGVDSFQFVTGSDAAYNAAWEVAKARVCAILPISLISKAVPDARRRPCPHL